MSLQIGSRLARVKAAIRQFEAEYQRPAGSVCLVAASKTKGIEDILEANAHGQCEFGESYVQEAVGKIAALADKRLHWHFIGPIQKNKTRLIAEHFDWVHSVDRLIIAQRLNAQRPVSLLPLQICIQVKLDHETSKSGIAVDQIHGLVKAVRDLPRLKLRGLMAIPQPNRDTHQQRLRFALMRQQLERLNHLGFNLDTLSMGMSNDLEAAIAEGATMVRVGTAIFGKRSTKK